MLKKALGKKTEVTEFKCAIEAGQTPGMNPELVFKKYFSKRNEILKLLRIYSGQPTDKVAARLGITESELLKIEASDQIVPIQLLPKLSELFGADLKIMLKFLGHIKQTEASKQVTEVRELAFATQYSGPELSKQEKIDLEELFKKVLEHRKKSSRK